ncbi:MAG: hypothetical protein EP330_27930 [Deltaproteobacteria bacterium]|nr:MAG: hypothetical protein EP330_27930 [Deltaproteobacteria bacterium]
MDAVIRLGQSPYAVVEPIATGGFARVWRGVHLPTGRGVAVKVVAGSEERRRHSSAMLRRELRLLSRLDHPHVVRVHDLLDADAAVEAATHGAIREGSPALIMDWCAGGSLEAVEEVLEWGTLRGMVAQLLAALAHAHARGVLHLDVKPPNLFVTSRVGWTVALGDFGVAALHAAEGEDGRMRGGTEGFMAPEQARRRPWELQPHTDVYAVGRTLEWLLDRHRPMVPAGTEELVAALTAFDPAHRIPTAARALGALRALGAPEISWTGEEAATASHTVDVDALLGALPEPRQAMSTPVPTTLAVPPHWLTEMGDMFGGPVVGSLELRLAQPPMFARTSLQARLWDAVSDLRERGTEARLWLRGPFGVGRSRLARELLAHCEETGAARTLAIQLSSERAVEDAVREAVVSWLGAMASSRDERLLRAEQVAEQLDLERSLPALLDLVSERVHGSAAVDCLVELLADRDTERWVVLVDDADAHPRASGLLATLAEQPGALVIATAGAPAPARWSEVVVPPLTAEEYRVLAARLLPGGGRVHQQLVAEGRGLPLELVERLRLWLSEGALRRVDTGWDVVLGDGPIGELWEARLAAAARDASEERLLAAAALLGTRFRTDELATLDAEAHRYVDHLASIGLIAYGEDQRWAWEHEVLRRRVADRAERAVAEDLASGLESQGISLQRRALLWERAGNVERARALWIEVVEQARGRDDDDGGLDALGEVERLGEQLSPADPRHLHALVLRGLIHEGLGEHELGAAHGQRIRELGEAHGWPSAGAYASWLDARRQMFQGARAQARDAFRVLDAYVGDLGDDLLTARVAFDLGRTLAFTGDPHAAIPVLERALQGYVALAYINGINVAAPYLGYAMAESGDVDGAMALLARTASWAALPDAHEARALRELLLANLHSQRGEHELEEQALLREREAQPFRRRWLSRINLALCRLAIEVTPGGIVEAQAAIAELEAKDAGQHARVGHALLLQFLAVPDRREAFRRHLDAAEALHHDAFTSRELVRGLGRAVDAVDEQGWTDVRERVTSLRDTIAGRGR